MSIGKELQKSIERAAKVAQESPEKMNMEKRTSGNKATTVVTIKKPAKRAPFTYSFSELVDKLSIVSRKDYYGLPGAKAELDLIMGWLNDAGIEAYTLLSIMRITQVNADIWNKEHEMRNAAVGEMPLAEVGKIAEQVREYNKTRTRYMNELSKAVGDEQVMEKIRHLSEEVYDKYYGEKK